MKKIIALMMALAMVASMAACSNSADDESQAPASGEPATSETAENTETPAAELSGTVNTDGSTSMNDVMAAFIESFGAIQPDVTVNYSGTGSGSGITNVLAGTVDIGLSSRALTDEEKAEGAVETPARSPTGPSWAAPTPPSPSSAVMPLPVPAAPSRRSWAWRTLVSTPMSTSPPVRSSAPWPATPTPSATLPCPPWTTV